jgi:hypothetical protein
MYADALPEAYALIMKGGGTTPSDILSKDWRFVGAE